MIHLVDRVAWSSFALAVVEHDGYATKIANEVEVHETTQEPGLVDVVLPGLLVEERGIADFVDHHIGTVDGLIVLFPCITHEEVGGLDGEV